MGRQLLVEWQRGRNPDPRRNTYVLALWQFTTKGWSRLLRLRLAPGDEQVVRVQQADVTRDGHLDQVVTGPTQGSGDCGPRRVLATIHGRVRQILRLPFACDTEVSARRGTVIVDRAVYTAHDAHCCATFTAQETLRWNGTRLGSGGRVLFWNCGVTFCRGRPLHFSPRVTAFWDSRRGVAVGGIHPRLIAFTRSGGRRWTIADAAPVSLGTPRIDGAGRARIRFLHCHHRCNGARFAVTSNYGLTWFPSPRRASVTWPG
jgi:hypothetical protein